MEGVHIFIRNYLPASDRKPHSNYANYQGKRAQITKVQSLSSFSTDQLQVPRDVGGPSFSFALFLYVLSLCSIAFPAHSLQRLRKKAPGRSRLVHLSQLGLWMRDLLYPRFHINSWTKGPCLAWMMIMWLSWATLCTYEDNVVSGLLCTVVWVVPRARPQALGQVTAENQPTFPWTAYDPSEVSFFSLSESHNHLITMSLNPLKQ